MTLQKCSLQINLAPNDFPHARLLLPHQIKVFADQVEEIVLILDTNRSKGRFGHNWIENLASIKELIDTQCRQNRKVRAFEVDYSKAVATKIAHFFFGTDFIPKKDYRGGPFYSYFYGLYKCNCPLIFHLDSDMFLGGASPNWIKEAAELFDSQERMIICSPLPGPPHPAEILLGQPDAVKMTESYHFKFKTMSTRIFMINRDCFKDEKLKLKYANAVNSIKAIIKRKIPYDLPEHLISDYMQKNQLIRIDFLGKNEGLWSLHPPYRGTTFYSLLPKLLEDITRNNIVEKQRGNYDIVNEMCDWEEEELKLTKKSWLKKNNKQNDVLHDD